MASFDVQYFNVYTIVIVLIAIFVVGKCSSLYLSRRKYRFPPGPTGFSFHILINGMSRLALWDHKDRYGDISHMNFIGTDIIVLNSSEAIREACVESDNAFNDRPPSFMQKILPDIISQSPSKSYWKKLRQMMHTSLKSYGRGIDVIENVVTDELEYLETELLRKNAARDMHDVLEPSICNILYVLLLNVRFPYEHDRIVNTLDFISKLNYMMTYNRLLTRFPWLRFIPVGIGKTCKQIKSIRSELLDYLFEPYRNMSLSDLANREGIVFELLAEQRKHADVVSLDNVKGAVANLFIAGIITTSSSLYLFFLLMLHYPEVQKRIQHEIDEVIGESRRPRVADKADMPYTQACILELMRFGSIVPLTIPHTNSRDEKLRNYFFPKDTIVLINQFRVNHDPAVWHDPWMFEPTRFLDDDGKVLPASHSTRKNAIAFGVGTRACLGEVFAKTRQFLYVTHLLQRFNFLPANGKIPSCDPRDFPNLAVARPNRYRIKVQLRNE